MKVATKFIDCEYGWINMDFCPENQEKIHFSISYCFNNLINLIHWVEKAEYSYHAKLTIDEEGHYMYLSAEYVDASTIHLKIIGSYEDRCYLDADIDKAYFIENFKNEFCRFFLEDFDSYQWDKYGCSRDDEKWNSEEFDNDYCTRNGFKEYFSEHGWLIKYQNTAKQTGDALVNVLESMSDPVKARAMDKALDDMMDDE